MPSDENYYIIHGWMLNRMKLKGTQLQVFSIVYGFSQDGTSEYSGSLTYLCDFTGASKPTVIKALSELVDKGFIHKRTERINGVIFNHYSVNKEAISALPPVKNLDQGSKETLPSQSRNFTGGGKETLPIPYKENNKEVDKEVYKECGKRKRFTPPSVNEVREYCISRKNGIDPEAFVDYYEARGWKYGQGKPVVDWKAAVRTWERRRAGGNEWSTSNPFFEMLEEERGR